MLPRDRNPQLWAALQNALGHSQAQNPLGSRVQNLEQAIQHYRQALEVHTRQDFPSNGRWPRAIWGAPFSTVIRAAGTEPGAGHWALPQVLEVYTRQAFPREWAMTQSNLGSAFHDRIEAVGRRTWNRPSSTTDRRWR